MDFDEGKQFRIGRINVSGLQDSARNELLRDLPIKRGQIYSSGLWEQTLVKYVSTYPDCACRDDELPQVDEKSALMLTLDFRPLDEKSAVVMLTLDFRPCTRN